MHNFHITLYIKESLMIKAEIKELNKKGCRVDK